MGTRRDQGSALVISVLLLTLMSALAGALLTLSIGRARAHESRSASEAAFYLAENIRGALTEDYELEAGRKRIALPGSIQKYLRKSLGNKEGNQLIKEASRGRVDPAVVGGMLPPELSGDFDAWAAARRAAANTTEISLRHQDDYGEELDEKERELAEIQFTFVSTLVDRKGRVDERSFVQVVTFRN